MLVNPLSRDYHGFMMRTCFIGSVLLILAGCGQVSAAPTMTPASTPAPTFALAPGITVQPEVTQETPIMNEVPIPTPFDPSIEKIVTQAKNDLASRLAIDAEQIELLDAASVTWPDGSLGCPQPGMLYTQVQVDGIRIRFQAGEKTYEYHGGGGRESFLCE